MTKRAILISLSEDQAGKLLSFDDVTSDEGRAWTISAHLTRKTFPNSTWENFEISEQEFSDVGLTLLARLHALSKGSGN